MKKLLIFSLLCSIYLFLGISSDISKNEYKWTNEPQTTPESTPNDLTEPITSEVPTTAQTTQQPKGEFILTHYGADCIGCSGITASGYDVRERATYEDDEFGELRIVAAPSKYKLYSVLSISYDETSFLAIVLDRGGTIKGNKFDLLVANENEANKKGVIKNVRIEVLREGRGEK